MGQCRIYRGKQFPNSTLCFHYIIAEKVKANDQQNAAGLQMRVLKCLCFRKRVKLFALLMMALTFLIIYSHVDRFNLFLLSSTTLTIILIKLSRFD